MQGIISVIIPNYNHAPYLRQRIDSVLNQSYHNFELIILDDLSTDNSREVIESYRNHPKITNIVFNAVNSGSTFKQWEKGISLAKGEYVWLAESDDYADPEFLSSVKNVFQANPEVGLVYCGSNLADADNVIIGENIRTVKMNKPSYYLNNGHDECINYAFWYPIIPNASAVVFKKDLFANVNESFKEYKICGDWQFWIDVIYDSYIAYLPAKLNYFRQTNTSVSRSTHYSKNNFTIFYLERLKIMFYGYTKVSGNIPLLIKLKNVNQYLYEILLETFRKRIFLTSENAVYIAKSLFDVTLLTPLVFFISLTKVFWFGLGTVKRSIFKIIK
jgi:glycosyltransferase involved in cell wall biosynthesis